MTHLLRYGLRNVLRARSRSLALAGLLGGAALVGMVLSGAFRYLNLQTEEQEIRNRGSLWLEAASPSLSLGRWEALWPEIRSRYPALDGASWEVEASIGGLVGSDSSSAIASGVAFHHSDPARNAVDARLGPYLAETLDLQPGAMVSGLLEDRGLTFRAGEIKTSGISLIDRFHLRLPLAAFGPEGADLPLQTLRIWLPATQSAYQAEALAASLASHEALRGWVPATVHSTTGRTSQVRSVYAENQTVVELVLMGTLFLALLNTMSLGIFERQREFGTLRSSGTGKAGILFALGVEYGTLVLLSWLASALLATICALAINGAGGLVLPPPPSTSGPLLVKIALHPEAFARSLILGLACVTLALPLAALSLRNKTVVELLNAND